jgi:hypothetical protein
VQLGAAMRVILLVFSYILLLVLFHEPSTVNTSITGARSHSNKSQQKRADHRPCLSVTPVPRGAPNPHSTIVMWMSSQHSRLPNFTHSHLGNYTSTLISPTPLTPLPHATQAPSRVYLHSDCHDTQTCTPSSPSDSSAGNQSPYKPSRLPV